MKTKDNCNCTWLLMNNIAHFKYLPFAWPHFSSFHFFVCCRFHAAWKSFSPQLWEKGKYLCGAHHPSPVRSSCHSRQHHSTSYQVSLAPTLQHPIQQHPSFTSPFFFFFFGPLSCPTMGWSGVQEVWRGQSGSKKKERKVVLSSCFLRRGDSGK